MFIGSRVPQVVPAQNDADGDGDGGGDDEPTTAIDKKLYQLGAVCVRGRYIKKKSEK